LVRDLLTPIWMQTFGRAESENQYMHKRRMEAKWGWTLMAFFGFVGASVAQTGRKYSNEFLHIGVDAAAFGRSGAVVAGVRDVSAGYWNPAGLAALEGRNEAALMHAEYFGGLAQYDYFGFATPVDAVSTVGVSLLRFGVDDIPDTSELIDSDGNVNYDRIKLFSAADYALLLSYARRSQTVEGLRYGANLKLVYRQVGSFADAFGFGFDAGAQYTLGNWEFGAVVRDVPSTFNAWSISTTASLDSTLAATGNEAPENAIELTLPRLVLGAAHHWNWDDRFGLQAEANADFTFDGPRNSLVSADFGNIDPAIGLEADYRQTVFLRLGAGNFQRSTDFAGERNTLWQPNMGLGFRYRGLSVDYALTDLGDQSSALYSHLFTLKYRWGS